MIKPTKNKTTNNTNNCMFCLVPQERFERYLKMWCTNCSCYNYCTRKQLCAYLHENNLPVAERFICRCEKLYQQAKYFCEHAEHDGNLNATELLKDCFGEGLQAIKTNYVNGKRECESNNDTYAKEMLKQILLEFLTKTETLYLFESLWGKLS